MIWIKIVAAFTPAELEQARRRSSARFLEVSALQVKVDREYDDDVEGRISGALCAMKLAE